MSHSRSRKRTIRALPGGGILVETKRGSRLQFAIPPETIKDTMALPGGVPNTYVIPEEMFDVERGLSLSEVEFPIYFNLFVRKRPLAARLEQDTDLYRASGQPLRGFLLTNPGVRLRLAHRFAHPDRFLAGA